MRRAVVDKATGTVLRAGNADFASEDVFDSEVEEVVDNCPWPIYTESRPDADGQFHKWSGSAWSLGTDIDAVQKAQKALVKKAYLDDILWTDDVLMWYKKLVDTELNTADDDTAYQNALTYWQEGQIEYQTKKAAIFAEDDAEVVKTIAYAPTHA